MQTMQPSIMLGSHVWAPDRLPADEFRQRLDDIRVRMDRNAWKALLVYGDVREHAVLAYVSNLIPRVGWGMALVPCDGDPRLLCSTSARDRPAMRAMTWIDDVRSGCEWDGAFKSWFERFDGDGRIDIGTIGFDLMPPDLHQCVNRSMGRRFVLHRADALMGIGRSGKRPHELSMLRTSCKVVETGARTLIESWRRNGEPETAALDAERVARSMAAQDVRTLVSLDGGRTLVPFQGRFEPTGRPLAAYFAVKVAGYWADMFVAAGLRPTPALHHVEAALDAMVAAVWPRVRSGDIHAKAMTALRPFKLHPVLGDSVGHGIGLSLHEGSEFRDGGDAILQEDGVYALQVGVADPPSTYILMSAIVRNTAKGAEVLACSPSAVAP
jgi:Xaa-Pro aminopeptidase